MREFCARLLLPQKSCTFGMMLNKEGRVATENISKHHLMAKAITHIV
jgi:hypothetical protein